jgi:hypothetical protein
MVIIEVDREFGGLNALLGMHLVRVSLGTDGRSPSRCVVVLIGVVMLIPFIASSSVIDRMESR